MLDKFGNCFGLPRLRIVVLHFLYTIVSAMICFILIVCHDCFHAGHRYIVASNLILYIHEVREKVIFVVCLGSYQKLVKDYFHRKTICWIDHGNILDFGGSELKSCSFNVVFVYFSSLVLLTHHSVWRNLWMSLIINVLLLVNVLENKLVSLYKCGILVLPVLFVTAIMTMLCIFLKKIGI